ncbi:MAG: helix-turn-helix domain-containing protein [Candidatus Micrarchaeia archaeon]
MEKEPRVGRPSTLNSEKLYLLLEAYYTRPYSLRQLASMFGVSRMTVWRTVQQYSFDGVKL